MSFQGLQPRLTLVQRRRRGSVGGGVAAGGCCRALPARRSLTPPLTRVGRYKLGRGEGTGALARAETQRRVTDTPGGNLEDVLECLQGSARGEATESRHSRGALGPSCRAHGPPCKRALRPASPQIVPPCIARQQSRPFARLLERAPPPAGSQRPVRSSRWAGSSAWCASRAGSDRQTLTIATAAPRLTPPASPPPPQLPART